MRLMLYVYIKSTSYDVWSKGNHHRKLASELSEEGSGGGDQH